MVFPDGASFYSYKTIYLGILPGAILIILSFLASQVFRDGELLRKENDLTV